MSQATTGRREAGLWVDVDACVGCGLCVRTCSNHGIEVVGRKARVTDGCVLCGICVEGCPVDALTLERGGGRAQEGTGFLVVCETGADGLPLPVSYELLGKAGALAAERGTWLRAVAAGPAPAPGAAVLLRGAGAQEAWAIDAGPVPDTAFAAAELASLVRDAAPEAVLFGATDFGRELAPRVAELLQTGLTADCTRLEVDPQTGLLLQTRPAFGGNLMATIACPEHRPQMATVRPGVFAAEAPEAAGAAGGTDAAGDIGAAGTAPWASYVPYRGDGAVRLVSCEPPSADGSIADAEVLVVVGRGIREKKNLALAERLAQLLGGQVACTRPLVEQGWLEQPFQVGQTGTSVAPRLLVSVGVSGAVQHLAGIGGAQTVVAVNEDPDAPIFSVAQYRVVGDCRDVLPALIAQLEERQG